MLASSFSRVLLPNRCVRRSRRTPLADVEEMPSSAATRTLARGKRANDPLLDRVDSVGGMRKVLLQPSRSIDQGVIGPGACERFYGLPSRRISFRLPTAVALPAISKPERGLRRLLPGGAGSGPCLRRTMTNSIPTRAALPRCNAASKALAQLHLSQHHLALSPNVHLCR